MASEAPIDIKALTASADSLSKALGALFDEETQYLDYLRKGRKRSFFVTAVSDSKTNVLKPVPKVIQVEGETKFNWLKTILCTLGAGAAARFLSRAAVASAPYLALAGLGAGLGFLKTKELEYEKKQDERLLHAEVRNSDRNNLKGEEENTYTVEDAQKNLDASKKGIFHMIGEGLSDVTGFDVGGVVKGATKSVVAEKGIPEWVIPFVKLGEIIKNTAYDPIGSLMIGAASSLFDILPLDSQSSLKTTIASLKGQFGIEKFSPAIRGSTSGITPVKDSLRVVNNSFTFFISNFFASQAKAAEKKDPTSGPVVPVNVPAGREAKIREAFQFYKSKGFSDTGAAYMVGNLLQESQLDPAAVGDSGHAHGIAQWRDDAASGARWLTYLDWASNNNKEPGDFYAQLEYTIVEGEKYNAGLTMMKGDNKEDHKKFISGYEGYSEEGDRFGYAEDILRNLTKYTTTPEPQENENLEVPEAPTGKVLSLDDYLKLQNRIAKYKQSPGSFLNNKPFKVHGVGTILVGKNFLGVPKVKYFNTSGIEVTESEWGELLEKVSPEIPPELKNNKGGPDLSPRQSISGLNPVTSQKDTMDLNLSVETRDERAMERVDQNSISFVPILIPGQVIEQVQMVPIESRSKKDVSYIDPFSHGVKRGSRKVL